MDLKYIVTQYGFAIFSAGETHKKIAAGMEEKPIGAGFCRVEVIDHGYGFIATVHCYGESVSLGIKSRPEDGEFINRRIKNDL